MLRRLNPFFSHLLALHSLFASLSPFTRPWHFIGAPCLLSALASRLLDISLFLSGATPQKPTRVWPAARSAPLKHLESLKSQKKTINWPPCALAAAACKQHIPPEDTSFHQCTDRIYISAQRHPTRSLASVVPLWDRPLAHHGVARLQHLLGAAQWPQALLSLQEAALQLHHCTL